MGLLTDLVVANSSDGAAIGTSPRPAKMWPTLELKGVETVKLSTLYCCMAGGGNQIEISKGFRLVGGNAETGPWVLSVPAQIAQAIASTLPTEIPAVAAAWAATDELQADRWTQEHAAIVIGKLAAHAALAASQQKSLFLRISL